MATAPIAKINIKNSRTYIGAFGDADALRNYGVPLDGDYAQIYTLQRIYKFDASSTAVDDGVNVIKPNAISSPDPGRWHSTGTIELEGTSSIPSDSGSTIVTYEWAIISDPSLGASPPSLSSSGGSATLTLPSGWYPGSVSVFLKVTDDAGNVSEANPFSPLLNQDAIFVFPFLTPNFGFEIPPIGGRNYHRAYIETIRGIDDALTSGGGGGPGTGPVPTSLDKIMHPTGPAIGDNAVVPGIAISQTPAQDSYVRVFVNGIAVTVGDGTKTQECYFSSDAGVTAKAIADIAAGDVLVWNASVAGYDLSPDDTIEFDYVEA